MSSDYIRSVDSEDGPFFSISTNPFSFTRILCKQPIQLGVPFCLSAKQYVHMSSCTFFTFGMRLSSASLHIPFWLMLHNMLCHNSPVVSIATFTSYWDIQACISYKVLIFRAQAKIGLPPQNFMVLFRMIPL